MEASVTASPAKIASRVIIDFGFRRERVTRFSIERADPEAAISENTLFWDLSKNEQE